MLLDGSRRLEGCCWLDRQERSTGSSEDDDDDVVGDDDDEENNRNADSDAAE